MPKVSVIIPVYNVEKYVTKCLNSVVNQTFKNLEIIIVNDCTQDNSMEIIQKFANCDKRIKIINRKSNGGLSAARNSGLNYATGDYIYFLDSDDWIEDDYIETMVRKIEETKSDIVINRNIIAVNGDKKSSYNVQQGQYNILDDTYIDKEKDTHNIYFGVWTKIYSHNFIKKYDLKFPEGYIYEDIYYQFITFANADKIYFFKGSPYYYRKTDSSLSSKIIKDSDKIIKVFELVYDYYVKHNLLNSNIKIYCTMPYFNIQNEETYNAFKYYFSKSGNYILKNDIYNDIDKFFCQNILDTKNYNDYIKNFSSNVTISYIRRNNAKSINNNTCV